MIFETPIGIPSVENPLRLLIVEDDSRLADLLRRGFWKYGHSVQTASDGGTGMSLARSGHFDVIVLDIGLPLCDGWQIASCLRAERSPVGIVVLTARDREDDVVYGLNLGADDYVRKPFSFRELLSRVSIVGRRAAHSAPAECRFEDLRIDYYGRRIFRGHLPLHLSPSEFALMEALMRHAGKAVSREALTHRVWGPNSSVSPGALDTLASALRAKLHLPDSQSELKTVRGLGYALQSRSRAAEL